MKKFIIKNKKTKKFINIDRSDGGYPYEVDEPIHAKIWTDKSEAFNYQKIFKNADWELHTIVTITSVIPVSWN